MLLLKYMKDNNLEGLVFTNPTNIFYLTNFKCNPHERLLFYIVKNDGSQYLLCPKLEEEVAKNSTKNIQVIGYLDTENGLEKLHSFTGNISSIAVEKEYISLKRFEDLKNIFEIKSVIDGSKIVKDMRKYKNEDEIKKLEISANLADKCIEIAKSNLKVGITELELKSIIENEIKKLGASSMSFDSLILFGENAANPHGTSGDRKLKENEFVLIDIGCYYKGYASDITRVLEFGKVSKHHKDIYNIVLKANTEAIKAVKPGVSFAQIDKIARDIITKEGYGEYFNHRLGHGLGLECHEYPDVSQSTNDLLEEGMCFTIEPGIYLPNDVGVRIEDDILVTKDGFKVLTKYNK